MLSAAALPLALTLPFLSLETQLARQHWLLLQTRTPVFKKALLGRRSSCSENGLLLLMDNTKANICML